LEKHHFYVSMGFDTILKSSSNEDALSILRGVVYIKSRIILAEDCIFPSSLLTSFYLDRILSIKFDMNNQLSSVDLFASSYALNSLLASSIIHFNIFSSFQPFQVLRGAPQRIYAFNCTNTITNNVFPLLTVRIRCFLLSRSVLIVLWRRRLALFVE